MTRFFIINTTFKGIFFLLIVLFPVLLRAQKQDLKFKQLTLEDSHGMSILQDRKGFMWFGTRDGLNKYDGYTFTIYKNIIGDSTSISGSIVRDILEDKEGNLWVATFGGLSQFNRSTHTFRQYKSDKSNPRSLAGDNVESIF